MERLRIALITGIDKTSKQAVVQKAQAAVEKMFPGYDLFVYDMYEEMRELARKDDHVADRANITQMPPDQLKGYRIQAYEQIVEKFDRIIRRKTHRNKYFALVLTRTIAPAKGGFYATLDESHKRGILPECCFTVTDDVQRMVKNLQTDEAWRSLNLDELGVLEKRQQEIENAERWAKQNLGTGRRHFLLAVNEPSETLLDTLFPGPEHPRRKRAFYLSFPITEGDARLETARKEFRDRLRKRFVVFDPGSIREYDTALKETFPEGVTRTRRKKPKTTPKQTSLLTELGNVTVRNDLRLIDQSDGVVVYYPSRAVKLQDTSGKWKEDPVEIKVFSAGVISEIIHAHNHQRKVHVLWLSDKIPSPFLSFYADKPIFPSETEFFRSKLFK